MVDFQAQKPQKIEEFPSIMEQDYLFQQVSK